LNHNKIFIFGERLLLIMKEKISLDTMAKVMTGLVFAILISVGYFMLRDIGNNEIPWIAFIAVFGIFFVSLGIAWGFHPVSYEIERDTLIIHRPFGDVKIEKENIVNIESIDSAKLRFGVRLFASGGFFGYYGLYSSNSIGRYYRYTGHSKNLVMIETDKRRYVISPDTQEFAKAVLAIS